ncbi:MAG: GNAT family N-acetyltransferase, partial [Chloroflexaceae bacterium]|nr:GNAT family N-acetyltransferase [Chloroflexaceae bacterium]
MTIRLLPLTETHARQILAWRYPPPYDFYNYDEDEDKEELAEAVAELLNPAYHYYAVLDATDSLLAYRCFGPDAQVPGGDYRAPALDMGGGLRPDLTGQGLGPQVMQAAIEFARAHFNPPAFRVTVAAWNGRALRACE